MCFETYERLLRARVLERAAERSAPPDPDERKPKTPKHPVDAVTLDPVLTREEEPV